MPSESFKPLLDREKAIAEAQKLIEVSSSFLQEVVNFSTIIFDKCNTAISDETEDENFPTLSLYQYMIEMTDSIEVLLSQSCVKATIPLLRSSFEALLGMEYLFQEEYYKRSLAWMYVRTKERITDLGLYLKDSQSEEEKATIIRQKGELELELSNSKYQQIKIKEEYDKRRHPKWYSLFGGPANFRELTDHLDKNFKTINGLPGDFHLHRLRDYNQLYTRWSGTQHADSLGYGVKMQDGSKWLIPLRNWSNFKNSASYAGNFLVTATLHMTRHFFEPNMEEKLKVVKWYKTEYQPLFSNLIADQSQASSLVSG